jgi:hypothetical protein
MCEEKDQAQFISMELDIAMHRSRKGQRLWSFANHGSTICIVVFSATAGILAQIDNNTSKTMATILSLLVTIIATIQSKLGFERKWIANRMTHSALRQLELDQRTGAPLKDVTTKFKEILAKHDQAITATSSG